MCLSFGGPTKKRDFRAGFPSKTKVCQFSLGGTKKAISVLGFPSNTEKKGYPQKKAAALGLLARAQARKAARKLLSRLQQFGKEAY